MCIVKILVLNFVLVIYGSYSDADTSSDCYVTRTPHQKVTTCVTPNSNTTLTEDGDSEVSILCDWFSNEQDWITALQGISIGFRTTLKIEQCNWPGISLEKLLLVLNVSNDHLHHLTLRSHGNKRQINGTHFGSLPSLRTLDISFNGISYVAEDTFEAFPHNLTLVNLSSNFVEKLIMDLPGRSNEGFCNFTLIASKNRLTSMPQIHGCISELLDLSGNRISVVDMSGLSGCEQLKRINLANNVIEELSERVFSQFRGLVEVDLSGNRLQKVPDGLLLNQRNLQILKLSRNLLQSISPDLFNTTTHLRELHLTSNNISRIAILTFKGLHQLHYLDLSKNHVSFPYYSVLQDVPHSAAIGNILWLIDLAKFSSVSETPITVNLSKNDVQGMEFEHFHNLCVYKQCNRIEIILDENPVSCDCRGYSLISFLQGTSFIPKPIYNIVHIQAENLTCASPAFLSGTSISKVNLSQVYCDVSDEEVCISNCTCKYYVEARHVLIDCRYRYVPDLSTKIPQKISVELMLNAKNNSFRSINEFFYINRNANITALSLSYSKMERLPKNISYFRYLRVLRLDHNNFKFMNYSELNLLENLPSLNYITLGYNHWNCDCSIQPLFHFLSRCGGKVLDLQDVNCSRPDGEYVHVLSLNMDDECRVRSAESAFIIHIIRAIVIIFFVCILMLSGRCIYKYRQKDNFSSAYSQYKKNVASGTSRPKIYDAFISFSHLDEEFVTQQLVPELEQGGDESFKLCIHLRNFVPGEYITDQIIKAIEQSRKTIIVLSQNYVKSAWTTFEFQTALMNTITKENHELVIILLEPIDPRNTNLNLTLKSYLRTRTYLEWEEKYFWSKLRAALRKG